MNLGWRVCLVAGVMRDLVNEPVSIYMMPMERVRVIADHETCPEAKVENKSNISALRNVFLVSQSGFDEVPVLCPRCVHPDSFQTSLNPQSRLYQDRHKACRRNSPKPWRFSRQATGCEKILRYIVLRISFVTTPLIVFLIRSTCNTRQYYCASKRNVVSSRTTRMYYHCLCPYSSYSDYYYIAYRSKSDVIIQYTPQHLALFVSIKKSG